MKNQRIPYAEIYPFRQAECLAIRKAPVFTSFYQFVIEFLQVLTNRYI
jgi:hypothetical protein